MAQKHGGDGGGVVLAVVFAVGALAGGLVVGKVQSSARQALQTKLDAARQQLADVQPLVTQARLDKERAARQAEASASEAARDASDDQARRDVMTTVRATLRDPDSAQFGPIEFRGTGPSRIACGHVNAKNAYGGYVGMHTFVLDPTQPTVLAMSMSADGDGSIARAVYAQKCGEG